MLMQTLCVMWRILYALVRLFVVDVTAFMAVVFVMLLLLLRHCQSGL